ncbi:MAG: hypothetical protein M0Q94_08210 [Candidatus Cloacimonetes bacterium]|nr:hypothetical protein [Candidatus Cloacimonadota bacterium]
MSDQKQIKIGWASISLVSDRPVLLAGQMYYRVSRYVHDPVTATAVAFDNGDASCIMVSCDMVGISDVIYDLLCKEVDGYHGFSSKNLTCGAIHSHNNSRFTPGDAHRSDFDDYIGEDKCLKMDIPDNILAGDESTRFWLDHVSQIIKEAWDIRKPGAISVAHDYASVAFNRRPVFQNPDGTEFSKMYGTCSNDNFIRFEGSSDHSADMLYTFDLEGNVTGVLVDIPCPSQIMELHYFVSADYWHYARGHIREKLGKNVYVLPICGPAGDQNPIDLVRVSKVNQQELVEWNAQAGEVWCNYDLGAECDDTGSRIADAVERGYKKARNTIRTSVVMKESVLEIKLPIRKVSKADYEEAVKILDAKKKLFSPEHRMTSSDQVSMFEPIGVIKRWELQNKQKNYTFKSNVIRIGDAVFASNPFELFVEYSFRIKARAKAQNIFLMQLTNGVGGYLPTKAALAGGSYSSKPASTVVGPDEGTELCEIQIKAIDDLMK